MGRAGYYPTMQLGAFFSYETNAGPDLDGNTPRWYIAAYHSLIMRLKMLYAPSVLFA